MREIQTRCINTHNHQNLTFTKYNQTNFIENSHQENAILLQTDG